MSEDLRRRLRLYPLAERPNKVDIERDCVAPDSPLPVLADCAASVLDETVARIRSANSAGRPVMLAFGAHTIKNGLGPILRELIEGGWVQHLATNGAGVIHDWEFAFQGKSSEDVRANVATGRFGIWRETGFNINLALALGAFDGLGYGESVGRLIATEKHVVPERADLVRLLSAGSGGSGGYRRVAAAADLLALIDEFQLEPGTSHVPHPWKRYSIQAAAYAAGVPFTAHPMFGHDIVYTHPLNCGAAVGRTAERDFLTFATRVADLQDGVYLSVGSAVMSPMIFEKSLSMAQNLALQEGRRVTGHFIVVVDLAESRWDWSRGEPPQDSPDYYLRFCKTFNRMGGELRYVSADNRTFLPHLLHSLKQATPGTPPPEPDVSLTQPQAE